MIISSAEKKKTFFYLTIEFFEYTFEKVYIRYENFSRITLFRIQRFLEMFLIIKDLSPRTVPLLSGVFIRFLQAIALFLMQHFSSVRLFTALPLFTMKVFSTHLSRKRIIWRRQFVQWFRSMYVKRSRVISFFSLPAKRYVSVY